MPRSSTAAAGSHDLLVARALVAAGELQLVRLGVSTVAPRYLVNERLLGSTSTGRLPAARAAAIARAVTASLSTPLP